MSWTTFQEIGKLKEAAEGCKFEVKLDIKKMDYIFPDGWRVNARHLIERSISAIISWLTVLWTIRVDANRAKRKSLEKHS